MHMGNGTAIGYGYGCTRFNNWWWATDQVEKST